MDEENKKVGAKTNDVGVVSGELIEVNTQSITESILNGTMVREALGMFGEDDSFFTKEELLEFASAVVDEINGYYKSVNSPFSVDYTGAWVESDDRTITVDFVCFPNETNYSISVKVDMRSIQSPDDIFKYVPKMVEELKKQISSEEVVIEADLLTDKILEGSEVRSTILEFLGNRTLNNPQNSNAKISSKLKTMCDSLMAEDIYTNSPKFQLAVGEMVMNYPTVNNAMIQLEFAEYKSDVDSSGVSLEITSLSGGLEYIEVSKVKNGVLNPVKRLPTIKYKEACNLFKSLVNNAEQIETDENEIFIIISYTVDGQEYNHEYTMHNPSYQGWKKAANEAKTPEDDLYAKLKEIETEDYQNRGGDYPEAGEPDTIHTYKNHADFSFKNTSEETASRWVERFLKEKGFNVISVSAWQDGDYHDDWVMASAEVDFGGIK